MHCRVRIDRIPLLRTGIPYRRQKEGYGYRSRYSVPVCDQYVAMLTIGVSVLFCIHVIDLVSHFTDYEIIVIMAVGEVAVPFVLWFVLAHKEILGNVR